MVAVLVVEAALQCTQTGHMGDLGINHGGEQVIATETFAVAVGLVFVGKALEDAVSQRLDDFLDWAYAVHGCSPCF